MTAAALRSTSRLIVCGSPGGLVLQGAATTPGDPRSGAANPGPDLRLRVYREIPAGYDHNPQVARWLVAR